jgi:aryl-alcohol dehydrogenase-like predicted oxidoreductase
VQKFYRSEDLHMAEDFVHSTLGRTGIAIHRLGLSTSYWPGRRTVYKALDEGVNYFFGFGIDFQLGWALRETIRQKRKDIVLATGAYNLVIGYPNLRRSLEKRLRQFGTDHIDVFLFLGVLKEKEFPDEVREELLRFKEEGKVRAIGLSTHNRKFAGRLAAEGSMDVLMIRYNAAHRGAEQDIFPFAKEHNPGITSYTATRWSYLVRRSKQWPAEKPIPTAGQCYRFVLSNPHVHLCLTAPRNLKQFEENLQSLSAGPLREEEMALMHEYGDLMHHTKHWFMGG